MTLNVLVVDEFWNGKAVVEPLEWTGYSPVLVGYPAIAREKMKDKDFDLLVIDPYVPRINQLLDDDPNTTLIKDFEGRVYVTTGLGSRGYSREIEKVVPIRFGQDYDRIYIKPFNVWRLVDDVAIDFNLPEKRVPERRLTD